MKQKNRFNKTRSEPKPGLNRYNTPSKTEWVKREASKMAMFCLFSTTQRFGADVVSKEFLSACRITSEVSCNFLVMITSSTLNLQDTLYMF